MSLRRRFVLVLAAYGVALAAVLGFVSWRISRVALEEQLDRRLTDVAGVAATHLSADMLNTLQPDDEFLEAYTMHQARLQRLLPLVDEAFIFHVTNRRLIVATDERPIGSELYALEPWWDEIVEAIETGRSTTRHFESSDGRPYKYGFVQIEPGSPLVLGVLIPADFLDPLARLRTTLLLGSAGAMVLAVLLGGLLAASIVGPIERLSRAALRIQRGHLDRPVEPEAGGRDEVASLARAMERMRVAIVERDERLRMMLAQVAHEVRNPLGGLELFAAAAASTGDPTERKRLLGRVRDEISALNGIITEFLTFARPLEPHYEAVDIRLAIEEAAELARGQMAEANALELRLPPEPLMAPVDRGQLKRAVLNLLRNAAQAGSRVRVWAEAQDGEVMIAVLDDGPGVSEEVRERLFEPFVTDKEAGAGLGLAIVRKVAEAHGGRVELRLASDPAFGSGAEFRLYFAGLAEPSVRVEPAPVG